MRLVYHSITLSLCSQLFTIVQIAPMPTWVNRFRWNSDTMIVAWWVISGVQGFRVQGPAWALWAILWNHAKCFFSHILYGTMSRACHNSAVVGVPSGCSGILGPRSRMGPMGHFVKSQKMLLLPQIVWYNVEGLPRYCYGGASFRMFRNFNLRFI